MAKKTAAKKKATPKKKAPAKKTAKKKAAPKKKTAAKKKAPARKKAAAKKKTSKVPKKAAARRKPKAAPKAAANPRKRETAESMSKRQREISISEFFTKNRHLLGFDNPRRALLTTIKEAVDNSLDACEEAGILPDIEIEVKPIPKQEDRFTVRVRDNGPGIVKKQIPLIFGKLLYGSKFHRLKMSRGQQGIGISAAGMYGQLTTGQPIRITSSTSKNRPAHYYEITIDTQKNTPRIQRDDQVDWDHGHGTQVEIDLEAKYQKGRQSIDEYIDETAIANPHVNISYITPDGKKRVYERSSQDLPPEGREIRPHPYGVELGVLIKMLHDTRSRSVKGCLQADFSRVSARVAGEILDKAGLSQKARPGRIARDEADRLLKAIQNTKIMNPPTDCISPIGEELILQGLGRIEADFYTSVTRSPSVYRGNPFLVEVGVAYGGSLAEEGAVRLLRFANRVPLLYQRGACAITSAVAETSWKSYGLGQSGNNLPVGPAVILVHLASVWVPFTSESKEAIAHYPEIIKDIKLGLQECGRRMAIHVRRRRREADAAKKRDYISSYIPHIANALRNILDLTDRKEARIKTVLTDVLEKSRKL
jgi:DNA topoisomerase VI subunit B